MSPAVPGQAQRESAVDRGTRGAPAQGPAGRLRVAESLAALWRHREVGLFLVTSVALVAGGLMTLTNAHDVAAVAWTVATLLGLLYASTSIYAAIRRRQPSVDIVACLALIGALLTAELFAGAMIAVMLSTGIVLEARASARARRELGQLVARAPRTARRYSSAGVTQIPIEEVARGDRLLVGSGEVVPVDGRLLGEAVLDESALTGEPHPVERRGGENVRSGVVNAGAPFDLLATSLAQQSTYAHLLRLVEQAQVDTSPFVRLADRLALAFVPLTLIIAGLAWWVTGNPVRAVAVLVVATPCPLLLAAPIAILSGLSRAARVGVVIKGGAALECLAGARVMLFDKTGTLTYGRPTLSDIILTAEAPATPDELLQLAGSLDQASAHVLAAAMVTAARERGLLLRPPTEVRESHGHGVEGLVGGRRIRLGKASWIVGETEPAWVRRVRRRAALDGSLTVFVSIDGVPAGAFLLEDPVRPDAGRMIRVLRAGGIERTILITGDRADMAEVVGRIVGVDAVFAERDPADKLAVVRAEQAHAPTIMVGDGINDAPALAAAGVGVALAARGTNAAAEAADVVLTIDRIDALADAMRIARRARRIAWRAGAIGMTLSGIAMLVAAAGYLDPAAGALLQELIDVAAIGIGLTALLPDPPHMPPLSARDIATAQRLHAEHCAVRPVVERVRVVADTLATPECRIDHVRGLLHQLEADLLQHERAEEAQLLPIVAKALGGADPTGVLSRTHAEIEHQISRLRRILDDAGPTFEPEDIGDLRRLLYGLYAILRLHNAQEEEGAFSLVPHIAQAPLR